MDITLEWEGISGIIKILLSFSIPLIIGFIIGRKKKKMIKKLLLILFCLPMIGFGQNKVDLKSESEIENYLNSSNIDFLEGIWYFTLGDIGKKLAIIKHKYQYRGTVMDDNNDINGFKMLNITTTHIDNIFIIEIFDKIGDIIKKIGTTEGIMKEPGLIELNFKSKEIKIHKVFPEK
tara:strand:- start:574 stop:1104 length:531 start_codon:yes stop_codon:yes gene_type:complete